MSIKQVYSCRYLAVHYFSFLSKKPGALTSSIAPVNHAIFVSGGQHTIASAGDQQSLEVADMLGSNRLMQGDSSDCKMVTFSPSNKVYPHLKTVDFGTGCVGPDGLTRSGKRLVTVYADWKTAAAGTLISETTFSDFWVDSLNISGNVKTYIDTAAMPGPFALKIVSNKTLTDQKGNTSTFISTNYWVQTAGDTTTTKMDNVYQITGSANGTEVLDGSTAISWTSMIDPQHQVIKMGNCYYRSSGIQNITLTLAQGTVFNEILNYGNGTCDNNATLIINGGTPQDITLPLRFWPLSL